MGKQNGTTKTKTKAQQTASNYSNKADDAIQPTSIVATMLLGFEWKPTRSTRSS